MRLQTLLFLFLIYPFWVLAQDNPIEILKIERQVITTEIDSLNVRIEILNKRLSEIDIEINKLEFEAFIFDGKNPIGKGRLSLFEKNRVRRYPKEFTEVLGFITVDSVYVFDYKDGYWMEAYHNKS